MGTVVTITWKRRQYVMKRDRYRCVQCGNPNDLTIDHVVPSALGGSDSKSNLQVLCHTCNVAKGDSFDALNNIAIAPYAHRHGHRPTSVLPED